LFQSRNVKRNFTVVVSIGEVLIDILRGLKAEDSRIRLSCC